MSKRGVQGAPKGSAYERTLARQFSTWWCGEATALHRVAGSGGRKSTHFAGGDIVPVSDRARDFPLCIEAKRVEKWSLEGLIAGNLHEPLLDFMCQCLAAARQAENTLPLLVCKKNRHPALAFLSTSEFGRVVPGFMNWFSAGLWVRISEPFIPPDTVEKYSVSAVSFFCIPLDAFFTTFTRDDFLPRSKVRDLP